MYKNNIISISGMPVSGKGTTISKIIEKLQKEGYSQKDIHLIETGEKFRTYFNAVEEVIKNNGNMENSKIDFDKDKNVKALFKSKNFRNVLIQTIIALKKEGYDFNKDKLSVVQENNMPELKEIREKIDSFIDNRIEKLGKEINSEEHPNEIWIIDSRLAFNNIPESFAVRLVINEEIAAERLYRARNRGAEDSRL